jgi:hypothetical protein
LPGIHGGAVTGLWIDNAIFNGCRLQILGKDPFLLRQQSDNVRAGTRLGSLKLRGLFTLGTTQRALRVAHVRSRPWRRDAGGQFSRLGKAEHSKL